MGRIDRLVGVWLVLNCLLQFAIIYRLNEEKTSSNERDGIMFLFFVLGIILAVAFCCWLSGDKEAKKCAGVTGIIYGIF